MSLFHRHTDYSIEQGNIRYMDGSSLLRPMDMPRSQQIVMAVFVVIAVIIGVRLAAGAITAVNDSNTQNKASVEENLSRTVSYNLPVLTQMADMDDQRFWIRSRQRATPCTTEPQKAPPALIWSSFPKTSPLPMQPPCTRRAWAAFRHPKRHCCSTAAGRLPSTAPIP